VTARVVSLVPSVTETLVAWGVVPVGVTRFCEQPGLPAVGGTKNPDIAAIVALAPDLVVLDREENRREDAEALGAAGVRLHVTHVRGVGDVAPMLGSLAAAVGVDDREAPGPAAVPEGGVDGLRVWVPIWRRPWMTISDDTYGGSVLAECGALNVFAGHPDRYPTVSLEEVVERRPQVVLAPTEPYPFAERHRRLFDGVAPMVIVDGRDLFWWGVRTRPAIARLREHLSAL
jgi:ABC-type Fe3+-hydroxamate transport system substrate-binding protein